MFMQSVCVVHVSCTSKLLPNTSICPALSTAVFIVYPAPCFDRQAGRGRDEDKFLSAGLTCTALDGLASKQAKA